MEVCLKIIPNSKQLQTTAGSFYKLHEEVIYKLHQEEATN